MQDERLVPAPRGGPLEKNPSWSAPDAGAATELHIVDYLRILWMRRWTVISVVAIVLVGTLYWTLQEVPIYRAYTNIQIDRDNPNILNFKDVYEVEMGSDDTLNTQFEVIKSVALATAVVEDLQLENSPEFQPTPPGLIRTALNDYRARLTTWMDGKSKAGPTKEAPRETPSDEKSARGRLDSVTNQYVSRVQVTPINKSRIVAVSFDAKDPELAAKIINAHATHFIEQNFMFKWEATQQASDFLTLQLKTLKGNIENAEDNLQTYSREHDILFTEEGRSTATTKLAQLETEYTTAQTDRIRKETYVHLVSEGSLESIESLPQLTNSVLGGLISKLADMQREDAELSVTYGPDYPARQRIQRQKKEVETALRNEKAHITQNVKAEYTAAVEHERLLKEALAVQAAVVNRTNQEIIQYNILKREVDSNKQLYDGLLTRLKEAGVSAGLRASNIRVVDKARVPGGPININRTQDLMRGLMLGLALAIMAVFLREYFDDSIKSAEDIVQRFGLPVLGVIPAFGSLKKKRYGHGRNKTLAVPKGTKFQLETSAHTSPIMAEVYRSFRTSLLLSSADHSPRSVLVTSAMPGEGKTVTSTNCAISLTQTGARVVLVDADMRRPRLHDIFGLKNTLGLSSLLTGSASLKDVIQESSIPNLYIIPSGILPPNPVELILSERFSRLMDALRTYFDHVIVDSPPVSSVSDPRVLAQYCDAILVVVKGLSTSRHQIRRALDHLSESRKPIAGVVLNDIDLTSRTSYYYTSNYYQAYTSHVEGNADELQ